MLALIFSGESAFLSGIARADEFVLRLTDGNEETITARWVAANATHAALELDDGRYRMVPLPTILDRTPGNDPEVASADTVSSRLRTRFGTERTLIHADAPYVLAYAMARPPDKATQTKSLQLLRKAGTHLRGMRQSFQDFAKSIPLELTPVKFPLVVLIFEKDDAFDQYFLDEQRRATGAALPDGLSIAGITAYYNLISNELVLRQSSCAKFDTPLHESVHQLAHNRGVFQRLAPVPVWINEGLATAFEGDGDRPRGTPRLANPRFVRRLHLTEKLDFRDILAEDRGFRTNELAAEAYSLGWALHWYVLTQHKTKYAPLLAHYGALAPLSQEPSPEARVAEFEQVTGLSLTTLRAEVLKKLPEKR